MRTTIAVGLLILLASVATAEDDALATAGQAFSDGDYEKVVELCAEIGSESEDHARALYLAGEAHLQLQQHEKAEAAFRSVLLLRPKAVPAMTGLGRAQTVERVRVVWPDGAVEEWTELSPGHYVTLRQGSGEPTRVTGVSR